MNILYYCWDEYTSKDIIDIFERKGYKVDIFDAPCADKLRDETFMEMLRCRLKSTFYDCIFTFNFWPIISKVANELGIKYVSWNFDSPFLPMYSKAILNSCNYVFGFDRIDIAKIKNYGAKNVYHLPLAVNMNKVNKLLGKPISKTDYKYDVTFVGKLYNDEYNFYDQIKNMPEYYRGFFDGIINAQMNIYGYDLASDIITEAFAPVLHTFASFNQDEELFLSDIDFFVQMLQKKITVVERPDILAMIADAGFYVNHFAWKKAEKLKNVKYRGSLDYDKEMPRVFRESKINLNITLRTILSGIPLRCMDIMGAGGFLLSNYQPELAEYFVDGQEVVMYSSRADLLDKIDYYLSHDEERIEIATNGRSKIENNFSYDILLDEIFKTAGLL